LKIQRRRERYEQEAAMQSLCYESESEPEVWTQIAPMLDAALARLGKKDHDAVVLRFFEGRRLDEVGKMLGTSEAAAGKRVLRALGKLRQFFTKRGVTASTTAIVGAISANAVQAAPEALAVSAAAAAQGSAVTVSTLTLVKGTIKMMTWAKIKTVALVGSAVILAIGTTVVVSQAVGQSRPNSPSRSNTPAFGGFSGGAAGGAVRSVSPRQPKLGGMGGVSSNSTARWNVYGGKTNSP